MNKQIKDILEYMKVGIDKLCISKPNFSMPYKDAKKLYNYTINLQKQLKATEEACIEWKKKYEEKNKR